MALWHLGQVSWQGKGAGAEGSDSDGGRDTPGIQEQIKGWDQLLACFHLPEEERIGLKRIPEVSAKSRGK